MSEINDYYSKYLTAGKDDIDWGLHVLTTGFTKVPGDTNYPMHTHPSDHFFTWERGRILGEYQLIYITRGSGVFESASTSALKIQEGTILLLFPGEWHRYKPDITNGWDEYWVGFNGPYAQRLLEKNYFTRKNPVLQIEQDEDILRLFLQIIENVRAENIAYQQVISAVVVQLLANIYAVHKRMGVKNQGYEKLIQKVKCVLMSQTHQIADIKSIAEELHVSYSWLRKMFKYVTGLSPYQYHLQLRIRKASHLLTSTDHSIKDISYITGFESQYYFARIFKQKTGLNPTTFRKQRRGIMSSKA
jgi:AraC-like DNA-binding protein